MYFFGRRGNDQLRFEDFQPFVENLQTEVLQMEYHEFSKGADTITELDFARILLRCVYAGCQCTVSWFQGCTNAAGTKLIKPGARLLAKRCTLPKSRSKVV